jgi:hypothetical protein
MLRTMLSGWRRYERDADARVRERFAQDAGKLRRGYGAPLWAMERFLHGSNRRVSERVAALRQDIEREFGVLTAAIDRVAGLARSGRRGTRPMRIRQAARSNPERLSIAGTGTNRRACRAGDRATRGCG